MRRTTIFADDRLIGEIKALARQENRSAADVVREAMEQYLVRKRKTPKRLSFIGVGESGHGHIAERHEDLLWKKPGK